MAKNCREPSNSFRCALVFLFNFFLLSCGLPTNEDYCPPPIVLSADGAGARVRLQSGSKGFVLYYKVKSSGDTTDDQFIGQGEQVFSRLNYRKAAENKEAKILLWSPKASTVFPVQIQLEYASITSPYIKATIIDDDGNIEVVDIKRFDGQSAFNNIKTGDPDASGLSGNVDIALAMMNFSLNEEIMSLNPSVGVYIGRMPNISIN